MMIAFAALGVWAQSRTAVLTGVVTDPSGAVVPGAQVAISDQKTILKTVTTDGRGRYTFDGLPSGDYRVEVSAQGFESYQASGLTIPASGTLSHAVRLAVGRSRQEITVTDSGQVDLAPSSNAGALTLQGTDLATLSDDPDDLATDLQALAGPATGPDGGEIFVDGFSGGKLPPKTAIREVRVNQNPFSAEYDRLGFGRIEIFTKPGTDRFRGEAFFNFGDSLFNSRNPFAPEKPDYQRRMFEVQLGGPLGKASSFFVEVERRDMEETSVINALMLDSSLNLAPFRQAVVTPTSNTEVNTRIDRQLSPNHTLMARYDWEDRTQHNSGLDAFSLPSRAIHRETRDHVFQVTETAVLSPTAIHEVRLQYARTSSASKPISSDPAVQVPEAFTEGGAASGPAHSLYSRWELSDGLSLSRQQHMMKLGGRVRAITRSDQSVQNYNGAFTFASLDAYRLTQLGLQTGLAPQAIRAAGGGASQFAIAFGDPSARVSQVDAGVYMQDDWRIRPQLTLSAGFRYEAQNNIGDWRDFAPRIGIAWAPRSAQGKPPLVIRAGAGMFYDRVGDSLSLDAARFNGVRQRQYVVADPDFYPSIPPESALGGNLRSSAIRVMDHQLRAPYILQSSISVERQLPKNTTVSLSYTNSRSLHTLRSRNINAPLPGTFDASVPDGGLRPYPGGDIYLYESSGAFRQNQLILNVNARVNRRLSLFGYYVWNRARGDSDGASTFPANQYDLKSEFGAAAFDVRHRSFIGGTMSGPFGFTLSPFIAMSSGGPFNITLGRDLNGDSLFTDRPVWATDLTRASVVRTSYGIFDTDPMPGQLTIARNLGRSPWLFAVNVRLAKTLAFGEGSASAGLTDAQPHGPSPSHGPPHGHGWMGSGRAGSAGRYTLTFSVAARNLLNTVNLAAPVGNLSSPLFGTSVSMAGLGHHSGTSANRSIELQVRFSF